MQPSQGGSRGSTAEEQRLSQRASLQGDRASQSKVRLASQASSFQVLLFHKDFLQYPVLQQTPSVPTAIGGQPFVYTLPVHVRVAHPVAALNSDIVQAMVSLSHSLTAKN
jgi:hypothetical protein